MGQTHYNHPLPILSFCSSFPAVAERTLLLVPTADLIPPFLVDLDYVGYLEITREFLG